MLPMGGNKLLVDRFVRLDELVDSRSVADVMSLYSTHGRSRVRSD